VYRFHFSGPFIAPVCARTTFRVSTTSSWHRDKRLGSRLFADYYSYSSSLLKCQVHNDERLPYAATVLF
jgi:hypothetical protein